ncbi:hypothetical protein SAMN05428961_110146 [Paenibacillus sp. OK060]|nr:hypothetical protein SAMN05428961_110146 [Paenibacillus sp. OK060]
MLRKISRDIYISIHALHTECDLQVTYPYDRAHYFNPRTPYGVRHQGTVSTSVVITDFNPRTPYGVRLYYRHFIFIMILISIHALHTECD